jgi:two-component sensor histidine kinase
MALIHEKLYKSNDFSNINFNGYVEDLLRNLFQSHSPYVSKISIKKDVTDIYLGVETAIPCGLIINELVSNALKHAFPNGREGEIYVKLHNCDENKIELTVSDNGIGIPENLDIKNSNSLGLHLVYILTEDQLKGEIRVENSNGTKFQIKFKGKQ